VNFNNEHQHLLGTTNPLQIKYEKIFLSVLSEEMRLQSGNSETPFLLPKVPPSGNMK